MSYAQRIEVDILTSAGGAASVTSAQLTGEIASISYVKDGTNGFADGSSFSLTSQQTGATIWAESNVNASATRSPRQPIHSTAGVAALYAAGGTAVSDRIVMANDSVVVAITSGGNAKNGKFFITVI